MENSAIEERLFQFFSPVLLIDNQNLRPEELYFLFIQDNIRSDNQLLADFGLMGSSAVDDNVTGILVAFDQIRRKPLSVGNVVDMNLLKRDHAHCLDEVLIESQAAFIFEVGPGHFELIICLRHE